jgi:hypothetical protein
MRIILDWDLTIKCKQERAELGVSHGRVESMFLAPTRLPPLRETPLPPSGTWRDKRGIIYFLVRGRKKLDVNRAAGHN